MEPIRPDDDELRAEAPLIGAEKKKPVSKQTEVPKAGRPASPKRSKPVQGNGPGRNSSVLLWVLLIGLACLAAVGWYSQGQRIQALEGHLEEADYWARQSKLALARFEGELSETGENLQKRGASLADQAAANKKLLDEANSEIRKLWVVANERNKGRLDQHQERLAKVEKGLAEDGQALATLGTTVEKGQSSLKADLAALQEANGQAVSQITALNQKVENADKAVENRIRRFEQEQKLGISGMESRIAALEKTAGDSAGVKALRAELNSLKNTVESIDSSRAQLTSRLVRLSEEVNTLRARQSTELGQ
ncbi:MAG TPA: hypothetical protein VL091_04850 [Marinobacter sp.]|nr:hypothetical protein [Marinobacter sp.]